MDQIKIENIVPALDLLNNYTEKWNLLLEKAPFHFNLIDEIAANENSHSKIVGRILQYQENNEFIYLANFLDRINLNLEVQNPIISIEKDRIDISILDDKYAIIIENKIHYAVDQDKQIEGYVNKILEKGKNLNQIYVLYLTRWGEKTPSKDSLSEELKMKLGERYKEISFRYEILPWLEDVLLICRQKDKDLINGINQYIDHLKGIFNLRTKFDFMNNEIKEFLQNQLSLTGVIKDDNLKVEDKIKEFELIINHLHSIREEITNKLRKKMLSKLLERLNNTGSDWQCVNNIRDLKTIEDANSKFFGFVNKEFNYKDSNLFFSIEIQNYGRFLCGIFSEKNQYISSLQDDFRVENINMVYDKSNWLHLHLHEYSYEDRKPAYFVYDDEWNRYYSNDMEGMVDMFYGSIMKVFNAWKTICENNTRPSKN